MLPMERHAGRFREEIPGAEFRVLRNLGHTPMWDDPTRVADLIGDFAAAAAAAGNGQASVTAGSAGAGPGRRRARARAADAPAGRRG